MCGTYRSTAKAIGPPIPSAYTLAKLVAMAITLLELQKARLPFISLVAHEDMEALGRRERQYLTRNADRQYPVLDDFKESAEADLLRLAAQPDVPVSS